MRIDFAIFWSAGGRGKVRGSSDMILLGPVLYCKMECESGYNEMEMQSGITVGRYHIFCDFDRASMTP